MVGRALLVIDCVTSGGVDIAVRIVDVCQRFDRRSIGFAFPIGKAEFPYNGMISPDRCLFRCDEKFPRSILRRLESIRFAVVRNVVSYDLMLCDLRFLDTESKFVRL